MKNKLRYFMVLTALAMCFGTFSVTAYAQSNEPQEETGTSPIMLVLIGVAVLAVGGLGYYFKIYKPKHELDDAADLDEFEFAGPEEPTIREEDLEEPAPELTAEEEAEQRRLYEEEQEFPDDDEDAPVQ